jgi:hypothetical protein
MAWRALNDKEAFHPGERKAVEVRPIQLTISPANSFSVLPRRLNQPLDDTCNFIQLGAIHEQGPKAKRSRAKET